MSRHHLSLLREHLSSELKYFEPFKKIHETLSSPESGADSVPSVNTSLYKNLTLSFEYLGNVYTLKLKNYIDVVKKGDRIKILTEHSESVTLIRVDLIDNFYSGIVENNSGSFAIGYYINGEFEGFVFLKDELLIIEKIILGTVNKINYLSGRTSVQHTEPKSSNMTITYSYDDLDLEYGGNETDYLLPKPEIYVCEVKPDSDHLKAPDISPKVKRSDSDQFSSKIHKICNLHIVLDPTFVIEFVGKDIDQAMKDIILLVAGMNHLYSSTDFDNDGQPDNIGFTIDSVTVYTSSNNPTFKDVSNFKLKYPNKSLDNAYLTTFSEGSFGYKHCLSLSFTFRDFSGINGLAYIGDNAALSGIFMWYNQTVSPAVMESYFKKLGKPVPIFHHYNTGLVNFKRTFKNKRQLRGLLLNTLAHEVGHTFGAIHDDDTKCSGTGQLMEMFAPPFVSHRLLTFSNCSKEKILPILKARIGRFQETNNPYFNVIA
ncbi:unnamed protein product [Gordionus sp. m RMFG-2023]